LKLQIKQLETQLLDQSKQQQGVVGQASDLDKRLAQMTAQTTEQQNANTQLQAQVKALSAGTGDPEKRPGRHRQGRRPAQEFDAQLKSLGADITALKKQGNRTRRSSVWSRKSSSSKANRTIARPLRRVAAIPPSSTHSVAR
jgi:DNA repair exonuclease SbcCD ATPase subunit